MVVLVRPLRAVAVAIVDRQRARGRAHFEGDASPGRERACDAIADPLDALADTAGQHEQHAEQERACCHRRE